VTSVTMTTKREVNVLTLLKTTSISSWMLPFTRQLNAMSLSWYQRFSPATIYHTVPPPSQHIQTQIHSGRPHIVPAIRAAS